MEIEHYLIKGGENLNDKTYLSKNTDPTIRTHFLKHYAELGENEGGGKSFLEFPVGEGLRLRIHFYTYTRRGHRIIYYFVGFVLPKELYSSVSSRQTLLSGLENLRIEEILDAKDKQHPITLPTAPLNIPNDTTKLPIDELFTLKSQTSSSYTTRYAQLQQSLLNASLDDWFHRLYFASNPVRYKKDYHCCLSDHPLDISNEEQSQNNSNSLILDYIFFATVIIVEIVVYSLD